MQFTGIIPLRAGSKRIPKKNIIPLNNIPLFCYSLDEALASNKIDNIIVSTDDTDVKRIIEEKYNNEIIDNRVRIFSREPQYSGDGSSTIDLILKDICEKDKNIDDIILLQATSPFRKVFHIDEAIELYMDSNSKSLVSLTTVQDIPFWQYYLKDNKIEPVIQNMMNIRSQDLPKTYILNGAIYISNKENLKKYNGFITNNTFGYIMDKKYSVDIDTEEDLLYAKFLLDNNLL